MKIFGSVAKQRIRKAACGKVFGLSRKLPTNAGNDKACSTVKRWLESQKAEFFGPRKADQQVGTIGSY